MPLDPQLLTILVCPIDKGPLFLVGGPDSGDDPTGLYNPRVKRRYPVIDGIPNLLPDDAENVDETTHTALMAEIEARGTRSTGDGAGGAGAWGGATSDRQP